MKVISMCVMTVLLGGGLCDAAAAGVVGDLEWSKLSEQVESRREELESMIQQARQKGLATDQSVVSAHVISSFQTAAKQDRDQVAEVRRIFGTFRWRKWVDTDAAADRLATDELRGCLEVADHALAALRMQLAGQVTLVESPDFSSGKMALGPKAYYLDDRPVFPYSLVWMPSAPAYNQNLGNMGGGYVQLTNLGTDGKVADRTRARAVDQTDVQVKMNCAPMVYLTGHAAADWMKMEHPEIEQGARNFTRYDIDNPLIRDWIHSLYAEMIPEFSRACGETPMMHLLANEPHFATKKGGWLAKNGVSDITMQKYRDWVAAKYKTVDSVNTAYDQSFTTWSDVTIEMPINPKLRGGAVWYDWCRFNMDRVNDWFTFLKKEAQANDPKKSPVSIKTLGHSLGSSDRDGGMDMEYLTKLQDVPGSDLRVVPQGTTFYGKNEDGHDTETGWASRYAYLWVDQSLMLDFSKSICPEKVFYDSEWHGFGTVGWRHFAMDRDYVRSSLWLAFTHGMGAIKPWVWGRGLDGALSDKTEHIGELSTQPIAVDAYGRVMKELNAHAKVVVASVPEKRNFLIYYCEEAAIQSADYMEQLTEVYEALKLLNVSVGFTTPSEIGQLDIQTQSVILPPTEYISNDSLSRLQTYQRAAGRMVMVGSSFEKNECGVVRDGGLKSAVFASISMQSVLEMANELAMTLAPITPAMPATVTIADQAGTKAYGVCMCQSVDPITGAVSIVLNNFSKFPRAVTVASPGTLTDVLAGRTVNASFVMKPCDVRVLRLSNE